MITVLLFVGAYFLIGCVFCAGFICRSEIRRISFWDFGHEEIICNFFLWPVVLLYLLWKVVSPIHFIYFLARICRRVSGKDHS